MGKSFFVKDLVVDSDITDFFLIRSCQIRTGSNGKPYFDATLGDKTGDVSAKKWDVLPEMDFLESLKSGDIVKIRARVTEWQSAKQLKILRIRAVKDGDPVELKDFVKAAPEPSEEMYAYIHGIAEDFADADLRRICLRVLDENWERLMYYPAASRNHHAEYGGLLYHTKRMLENAQGVCRVYRELDRELLSAGVILHDIEKLDEILSDRNGVSPGYSREGQFLGHLVMGVKYIDRLADELKIPEEKKLMLEQMILSHHYEPEFGSPVRPLFPEGEVLHYLDILDARLFDMREAVASVDPGHFSERVWTLDNRRVYRRENVPGTAAEQSGAYPEQAGGDPETGGRFPGPENDSGNC